MVIDPAVGAYVMHGVAQISIFFSYFILLVKMVSYYLAVSKRYWRGPRFKELGAK